MDVKRLVQQIPDFVFMKMATGFLSSAAFSKFRVGEQLADLTEEEKKYLMSEMKKIAQRNVSEEEALEIAYELTKRLFHYGYGEKK